MCVCSVLCEGQWAILIDSVLNIFFLFFFIIAFAELWLSDGEDVGAEGWAG